jgi:hypothetical protein
MHFAGQGLTPSSLLCCCPAAAAAAHHHQFGTLSHMPPCLLREGRLTTRADVYAFAMVMWQLFTVRDRDEEQ